MSHINILMNHTKNITFLIFMFLNVCDIEFKFFCSKDFFRIEMTAVFSYM